MEDVLVDGRLVTYHEEGDRDDTGLRFAESVHDDGLFTCPECGSDVRSETSDSGEGDTNV